MVFEVGRRDQGGDGLVTRIEGRGSTRRLGGLGSGTDERARAREAIRSSRTGAARGAGLRIPRRFTATPGGDGRVDPYETLEWERRTTRITNPDGSIVFEMKDVEIPKSWSLVAGDILASKYLR